MEDDIPTLVETELDEVPQLQQSTPTVPLTIICGFLGAGKSTLIKRILTERHGYRIAVIMNEFGDTADIEAKAINVTSPDDPSKQSEEFLELANGCLCCSIKDAGVAAIEKLMEKKGAFDHILLETTGLADPGPIASMFWQNEEFSTGLGREIHLDGVVCVVDAVFGQKQMEEDHAVSGIGESLRQIAGADVILLNKTDLVPLEEADHLQRLISQVNPTATIYRTVKGQIDLKLIMGIDAYETRRITSHDPSSLLYVSDVECTDSCKEGDHPHHVGPHHYEIRGISSLQVAYPPLTVSQLEKLDEWIRTVLWEHHLPGKTSSENGQLEILRCKGIFTTVEGGLHILQGVRNLYELEKVEDDSDIGLPDEGKLVLIGKGLDETVRRSLEEIVV
ncbi:cobW-domain-containing protein [Abortiporus biennis]|nr:cobW-domain-containing protein [Abortiporus biennis]